MTESAIYSMTVCDASVIAGAAVTSYSVPPSLSSAKYSFCPVAVGQAEGRVLGHSLDVGPAQLALDIKGPRRRP